MNKIGFSNFRRFIKFDPIEYEGITFLVGRNNSGKSTVVKALLLIYHYFKSGDLTKFSFGNNVLEDANIVTYGRARNSDSDKRGIDFVFEFDHFRVEISIFGEEDDTEALVDVLLIIDKKNNLNYFFEPQKMEISISKANLLDWELEAEMDENIKNLTGEIINLKQSIESSELKKSSKEYVVLIEELNSIERKRDLIAGERASKKVKNEFRIESELPQGMNLEEAVSQVINSVLMIYDNEFKEIQNEAKPSKFFKDYRAFKEDSIMIIKSFDAFYNAIQDNSLLYLGANLSKQSALFQVRDKSNALAQAINDFFQLRVLPGDKPYQFVEKWMSKFGVGNSFEILMHAGEAYEVKIELNGKKVHLADKGMGSLQVILLIFRLASIVHRSLNRKGKITVIIEEPELNLHPALQSLLADLFHEVNKSFKINFIIETHSEYLIRKTQLLVKQNEYEVKPNENPFTVIYFDKDMKQWNMKYREDGKFIEKFGTGFYDESSILTLNLL